MAREFHASLVNDMRLLLHSECALSAEQACKPQTGTLAPCRVSQGRGMGVSFLCICPPKSIQFEPSKDNSRAEISARLAAVDAFQTPEACQLICPGAGLAYLPCPDLSVKVEVSCFAAFKG